MLKSLELEGVKIWFLQNKIKYVIWNKNTSLPPQFSQGLAQFGVVQVRVLIRKLPAGRLRPNHESVHGSLDVGFILQRSVPPHGHRHQRPVVTLQDLRDGVSDTSREPLVILGIHFPAQTGEQRTLTVGTRRWGRSVGVGLVLWHGAVGAGWATGLVVDTLVVLLCHFQHYGF